jgi:hypothetical protein
VKLSNQLWNDDRDSGFVWMLVISVLMLITTQLDTGIVLDSKFLIRFGFFLFTIVAIYSSSLSVGAKRIGYILALGLLILAISIMFTVNEHILLLYIILSTGYLMFILLLVISQIFTGGIITLNKIIGGVAAYILIGHVWTSMYLGIYLFDPMAFHLGENPVSPEAALPHLSYFSFVTLTTIGYGDILALNRFARILVMAEGLTGQLFPAVFIAKLVALQIEHSRIKNDN